MLLATQLVLSHILGDFILQPSSWVRRKKQHKWRSGHLYVHSAVHGISTFVLVGSLLMGAVVFATHAVIDGCKVSFQTKQNERAWFFYDQAMHITVLVTLVFGELDISSSQVFAWCEAHLPLLTGVLIFTKPASIVISTTISRWNPEAENEAPNSLSSAGAYIGYLERLFVFTFVLNGQWSAIGFMLAAKSIFRFGDLTKEGDRKLTEYVLVGTLMSIGVAVMVGLALKGLET